MDLLALNCSRMNWYLAKLAIVDAIYLSPILPTTAAKWMYPIPQWAYTPTDATPKCSKSFHLVRGWSHNCNIRHITVLTPADTSEPRLKILVLIYWLFIYNIYILREFSFFSCPYFFLLQRRGFSGGKGKSAVGIYILVLIYIEN